MRRLILPALVFALAVPATAAPPIVASEQLEPALDDMARDLGDPARQQALARAVGAMADVVLDIPLAPILGPLAEAAGEDRRRVDPDATLRKVAPGAADAPRQIERQLPRAMASMAGMSGALAALLPTLRDAADRMRAALPAVDLGE